jgi:hypothetical protein
MRALIVLVLVIGGWMGWMVYRARVQRDAAAVIKNAGGWVVYDWEARNGLRVANAKPWWPKWLVDRVGVDYFSHVVGVGLGGRASDAEMACIGHLSRLQRLYLSNTAVRDAGLVNLKGLTGLQLLSIGGTGVSDAGLAHLKGLTRLAYLNLIGTNRVTDVGVRELKQVLPKMDVFH